MLKINHIAKTFNPGTITEKTALVDVELHLRPGDCVTVIGGNAEREEYRKALSTLGLGLESRMSSKVGLLSGGQRQALTLLMATLKRPKVLLLDEHTAALDPKTAENVLLLTQKMVDEQQLTAMMVTHNMRDALHYGNRTVMMHEGRVILDIDRETKSHLQVEDLLMMFEKASGSGIVNDRMLLG